MWSAALLTACCLESAAVGLTEASRLAIAAFSRAIRSSARLRLIVADEGPAERCAAFRPGTDWCVDLPSATFESFWTSMAFSVAISLVRVLVCVMPPHPPFFGTPRRAAPLGAWLLPEAPLRPTAFTYNVLMRALAECGGKKSGAKRSESAGRVLMAFDEAASLGLEMDISGYKHALRACDLRGDWRKGGLMLAAAAVMLSNVLIWTV